MSQIGPEHYRVVVDGHTVEMETRQLGAHERRLQLSGQTYRTLTSWQGEDLLVEVDGVPHRISRGDAGTVRNLSPAVVVSIPVAAFAHTLTMLQLDAVAAVVSVLTVVFEVSYRAYIPALLGPEAMVAANSSFGATSAVAEAISEAVVAMHSAGWVPAPLRRAQATAEHPVVRARSVGQLDERT